MSENDRFASYTRSASFAVTLSSAMIHTITHLDKAWELRARFPWFTDGYQATFGTAEELAIQWCTPTVRALAKRGLVDVTPKGPPVYQWEVITLTEAGRLMAALLREAGFTADPRHLQVPCHPDDRTPVSIVGPQRPTPFDRRLSMVTEADLPFMANLRQSRVHQEPVGVEG